MELSKSETKLLDLARRARPDSGPRRIVIWAAYLLLVLAVVLKVTVDFSRDEMIIGTLVILSFGMVNLHARFRNQAMVLLNKITTGADSSESIAANS